MKDREATLRVKVGNSVQDWQFLISGEKYVGEFFEIVYEVEGVELATITPSDPRTEGSGRYYGYLDIRTKLQCNTTVSNDGKAVALHFHRRDK